ncbi:ATP12 family chaperone protein [Aurantimonas sp. VKM B-3413]|uniref:ATP12 family chaperone protein n=1 Tax=Aurantimonas sp. VKM B-3413 TaxID=2779401 RepID=UPI001E4508B3|nr:ATP12 family protein [Aurantimonas sp. VKM B-3413]MCB8836871.1 ATPase [Aurantimonas sp. VKM B-3413]
MKSAIARPELPKRFYKTAEVVAADDGVFSVTLDGRPVKTPARKLLAMPAKAVAEAVAQEWRAQGEHIDPATMPMTRLVNTIVDGIVGNPEPVRDDIARYAETDMLFYRAGEPERLVTRQRERWDPILDWAHERLGARFLLAEGVMHVAQPEASLEAVRRHLARTEDPFAIAALHQATTLTGSSLVALALADGRLSAEEAWDLAHLDEDWNIEQWGADEEAMAMRAKRWEEMRVAALILGRG